jgi:hypothetical protein
MGDAPGPFHHHAPSPSQEKKKKYEPPAPPPRVGKKQKKRADASSLGSKLPTIAPNAKCKLRLLKLERVKDYLLMEEEFVKTQELLKPHEERNEEERSKVRGPGAGEAWAWAAPAGSPRAPISGAAGARFAHQRRQPLHPGAAGR